MPARGRLKRQLCSKLSLEQALQEPGPEGGDCWGGEPEVRFALPACLLRIL